MPPAQWRGAFAARPGGLPDLRASAVEVAYICGSSRFVPFAESLLIDCRVDPPRSALSSSG